MPFDNAVLTDMADAIVADVFPDGIVMTLYHTT